MAVAYCSLKGMPGLLEIRSHVATTQSYAESFIPVSAVYSYKISLK